VEPRVLQAIVDLTRREQALATARVRYAGGEMPDMPDKLGAIDAAAGALRDAGVAYALIGGVAVGIRSGVPRATLDFAIPTTADRRRAAADPRRPRSKALRDQAEIALLEGDAPGPDEGW
jgi:hypothetical protein